MLCSMALPSKLCAALHGQSNVGLMCYCKPCRSLTGPRSAVGNVSDYRCVSDCSFRGREFDPRSVPYFRGD